MSGVFPIPQYPDIILALSLLGQVGRYHWFLFVADPGSKNSEGHKIHGTDMPLPADGSDAWRFENQHVRLNVVPSSICAAAIIGRISAGMTVSDFVRIVETIPLDEVPPADIGREPKFTCRVWIKEVIRRLGAARFLHCPDVDALEQEMREYANVALEHVESDRFDKAVLVSAKASMPVPLRDEAGPIA